MPSALPPLAKRQSVLRGACAAPREIGGTPFANAQKQKTPGAASEGIRVPRGSGRPISRGRRAVSRPGGILRTRFARTGSHRAGAARACGRWRCGVGVSWVLLRLECRVAIRGDREGCARYCGFARCASGFSRMPTNGRNRARRVRARQSRFAPARSASTRCAPSAYSTGTRSTSAPMLAFASKRASKNRTSPGAMPTMRRSRRFRSR